MTAIGQRVGYIRVSSAGQNTARQLDRVALDRVFEEVASAKNVGDRPALKECIAYCRAGDTLLVHSLDRLARNLEDLKQLVQTFNKKGVIVRFEKEGLVFSGDDSPMSNLLLTMLGAVAEFERALIKERQREGIEKAKARGAYRGRKPALNEIQRATLVDQANAGHAKADLARQYGISRETLYAYLRQAIGVPTE